jgi:TfoX/Sxy family transcriptional regulator of competence genes
MAYKESLAKRIRERLADLDNLEEKEMMGGLAFMYNGKMCVGIYKDNLMCRIDPAINDELLEKRGCRQMDFANKPMKGWVLIDEDGIRSKKDFDHWIGLALEFNSKAKASKKRPAKSKK